MGSALERWIIEFWRWLRRFRALRVTKDNSLFILLHHICMLDLNIVYWKRGTSCLSPKVLSITMSSPLLPPLFSFYLLSLSLWLQLLKQSRRTLQKWISPLVSQFSKSNVIVQIIIRSPCLKRLFYRMIQDNIIVCSFIEEKWLKQLQVCVEVILFNRL